MPVKLVEGTAVPVPLGKPLVILYSTPYAVTAEQPIEGMAPARVAEVCVMALPAPLVTDAAVLTPEPTAATLVAGAPAPVTGIFPL